MGEMQTGIEYLKGVGPERARLLKEELNIRTFEDLLHFFPNRYIDRSQFYPINQLPQNNSEVQIKGKITQIEYVSQKRGKRMVAQFEDATGAMELVWFRGYQWIRESLKINQGELKRHTKRFAQLILHCIALMRNEMKRDYISLFGKDLSHRKCLTPN